MKKILVWDLPTRLFHWSLAILFCISLYTGFNGGLNAMDYHMLSGYGILGLVTFRILWGFVGSTHAKFSGFVRGPRVVLAYLRSLSAKQSIPVGHNPLGALSVLAMLACLVIQAGTGLFSTDDVFVDGPLRHLLSHGQSLRVTEWHKVNLWVLCGLVGMHLAAIAWYHFRHEQNLTLPMITGYKLIDADVEPGRNHLVLAIVLGAVVAAGIYYLVTYV